MPEPPEPPRRRGGGWLAVAVALAALVAIVAARDWIPSLVPSLPNPFAAETVDRTGPAVLHAVRDLEELRAATGHFEVIVDLERDTRLPSAILGERLLFVGVGDVDATVDLAGVGPDDVEVSPDRTRAVVTLPRPRLSEPRLDLGRSYVYDRRQGVLNEVGKLFTDERNEEREAYLRAERQIRRAAQQGSGLVARAERNAARVVERLLRALGFERVEVRFQPR